jgi:hypothetical protein
MRDLILDNSNLNLRAGELVEVKSRDQILATLDEKASLDALPFMPEMLEYCGRRFRVYKVAHKTCDTIETYKGRRMANAVHLMGLRCNGGAHGGCQAQCLLFWKEAWLTRVSGPKEDATSVADSPRALAQEGKVAVEPSCGITALDRGTRQQLQGDDAEVRYSCQATEIVRATAPLAWWEPWSYVKDITSGNVTVGAIVRYLGIAALNIVARFVMRWIVKPRAWVHAHPYMRGLAGDKSPKEVWTCSPANWLRCGRNRRS